MRGGAIAAGHPATAEAGAEILAEGGSAADAVVAASLASCVAETVMTGLLGGGHAIHYDAAAGRTANLDCFVAVPGLGREPREVPLLELDVPFGAELVRYSVGIGSCGVPGLPGGLDALWTTHGRLPWTRLVEPALALARTGVPMPRAHAACLEMLAPVMTMNEGGRIYSPGGSLLLDGDILRQPGLVTTLEALAAEGPGSVYAGTIAEAFLGLMEERGGLVTRLDLASYAATWTEPTRARYCGAGISTRAGISGVAEALSRTPRVRGQGEEARVLALLDAIEGPAVEGHTTNVSVVDGDGNACVLTTSLGLGSGDFVPGFDLHLNSMLGEDDLLQGPHEPGERMASMMAPTLAFADDGLALAIGAAGGTRLRTALVTVMSGILDEGLDPQAAIDRPRFHAVDDLVNAEPGFAPEALAALESRGRTVRVWPDRHHYFGGVSAVTPEAAAADPRRSGSALVVR